MRNGVLYARTEEGLELPVIDVTNPAFAVSATEEDLEAMLGQYIQETGKRQEIAVEVREALQASILRKSVDGGFGDIFGRDEHVSLETGAQKFGGGRHAHRPADRGVVSCVHLQDKACGYGEAAGGRLGG